MTIKIKEKEYIIKESLRSLMMFEHMTNKKAAEIEDNLTDTITIFYCLLKANNKDFNYTFELFIDLLEEDREVLNQLTELLKGKENKEKDKKKRFN